MGVELKKSEWPTRQELVESSIVVIISVAALGIFIGLCDMILIWALRLIVGN